MPLNWSSQLNWNTVSNYDQSASFLLFDAVGTLPQVKIPLFILEHNIPVRKAKITEVNTIEMANSVGWDTSFSAIFEGAPEPLQAVFSGYLKTPTVQVFDPDGIGQRRWSPTSTGDELGVNLGLQGWSNGDIISAYLEGRMNTVSNRWIRTDPLSYMDPFGHLYDLPIVLEFTCQNQAPPNRQTFSMTLILGI